MLTDKINRITWVFGKDRSWNNVTKCDILFIVYDINCFYLYKNQPYAPLLDSLREKLEFQGYKCSKLFGPFSKYNVCNNNSTYKFNCSFSRGYLYRKIYTLFFKEQLYGTKFISNVWLSILIKFEPKRIISIYPSESLCLAARKLNIDIAEMQHGVINDSHPAYGYTFKEKSIINILPTTFICFDQIAINTFNKWVKKYDINIELINNPWTERFLKNHSNDDLVNNAKELNDWIYKMPFDKSILISLGWGWEDSSNKWLKEKYSSDISMPQFHSLSLPLLDIIEKNIFNVNWLIRLHPVQVLNFEKEKIYKLLTKRFINVKNVYWIEPTQCPLVLLLQNINLHLTIDSTITSESSSFGIKSGLICPDPKPTNYLQNYFVNELENGHAYFVPNNSMNIINFIKGAL